MKKIISIISEKSFEIGVFPQLNDNKNSLSLDQIEKNSNLSSKISEEILLELSGEFKMINHHHNINLEILRRICVPFSHFIFDRYFRLHKLVKKNKNAEFYKSSLKYNFQSIEDLEAKFTDLKFNNHILSVIIENFYNLKKTKFIKHYNYQTKMNKNYQYINTMPHVFSNRVIAKFYNLIEFFFDIFIKKRICSFNLAHFKESFTKRLFLLKYIKFLNYKNIIQKKKKKITLRRKIFSKLIYKYYLKSKKNIDHTSRAKFIFYFLLKDLFPISILEGLNENLNNYSKLLNKNKFSYLILDGDYNTHETYIFSIMRHKHKMNIIRFNHGGGAGYIRDNRYSMEMVYKRCDLFISWGLNKFPNINSKKIVYLPNPWLSEKKNIFTNINKNKNIDILYFPQKIKNISGMLEGASTFTTDTHKIYFSQLLELVNDCSLKKIKIKIKPYSLQCYQIIKDFLLVNHKSYELLIKPITKSLTNKQIQDCKFILFDYPGTGFFECLTTNTPVIVLWNRKICDVYNYYDKLFDNLQKANISFQNIKNLTNFVKQNSEKHLLVNQKFNHLKKTFLRYTCRTHPNWYIDWSNFFKKLP